MEGEFPDEDVPDLNQLMKNTALLLNHGTMFTGDGLRPVHPQTIQAGLMTCSKPPSLTGELLEFVEEVQHSVVFITFGSVINADVRWLDQSLIGLVLDWISHWLH